MKCNKCGAELKENEKFCTKCGEKVEVPKNKNIGLIIGIGCGVLLVVGVIIVIVAIVAFSLLRVSSNKKIETVTTTTTQQYVDPVEKKMPELDLSNVQTKLEDNRDETKTIEFVGAYANNASVYKNHVNVAYINKNDYHVNVWIYINYYKDGVRIGSNESINNHIGPNVLACSEISLSEQEPFDSFDISFKTSESNTYYRDVEVNDSTYVRKNQDEKKADSYGVFTNPTKKNLYGYASCARYKGNDLVFVQNGYLGTVNPSSKADCQCYSSGVPENVEYDRTECNIYNVYYVEGE